MTARLVVIIGTWHHFQEGRPSKDHDQDFNAAPVRELERFLRSVIRKYDVAGVAEEMPDDRLNERIVGGQTLVGRIAHSLSLPYRNADLTAAQRTVAGFAVYPAEGSEEQLRLWEAREAVWRDGLIDLNRWPALFVCGRAHTHRFADLLSCAGIRAHVEVERWEPESN